MRRMPCSLQKILLLLMLIVGVSQIVLFHSYFATSTSHVPMQQPQQKPPRPHDVYAKEADDGNNNKNNNNSNNQTQSAHNSIGLLSNHTDVIVYLAQFS
eukprot:scaffold13346_cov243-Alexandrium_tamarense.AAC.3